MFRDGEADSYAYGSGYTFDVKVKVQEGKKKKKEEIMWGLGEIEHYNTLHEFYNNMGKTKDNSGLELVPPGFANGVHPFVPKQGKMTLEQKEIMITNAAHFYGEFLEALGCDWKNDPNSDNTPMRVAKAYVNDLWAGRYEAPPSITGFPSDGYDGIVQESNIPITSMCSHHHQTISGLVSIAYISTKKGKVVGLSKLNRIVEHFGRRGQIQEQLTVAIHNAVNKICEGNEGVAVAVNATHNCVSCRGVKHIGASMQTSKLSGAFKKSDSARQEFFDNIKLSL